MTETSELEQKRLVELEAAFELFNQTSTQLTQAYESLQYQVEDLQAKLAESDREKQKVGERLEQLLKLLPAGVIVLDLDQKIIDLNPAAIEILGRDAIGRSWDVVVRNVFLAQDDAGTLLTHNRMAYQLSESQLTFSEDDGSSSQSVGKILLIQDVTDARNLQQHVSRYQRLSSMGEMAASLAHQIRTPLASALLYVSQLGSGDLDEKKRQKFVDKSVKSLHHLENLIKDMLQYAKGGRVHDKKIQVAQLIENLKHAVESRIEQSASEIHYGHLTEELQIVGDADALLTALQNLVINAIDVVHKNAYITVNVKKITESHRDMVDIRVSDQGPGIDEALVNKIFEPFYTSRAQGTGLGLAVVRAVAEAHDGEAWVMSVPGKSTTFGIRLPLIQTEEAG
ncbi:sensor histidine kinase [Hydrogenovibrio kuenenii]|uniref:sensor histidine kinase n=1 Tax=Hydrogenovibrio kuenenii TaxID=63658 RepID=UPI000463DB8C|nr:ATP-binding protein [Hydrogenovibrio kuenenii]